MRIEMEKNIKAIIYTEYGPPEVLHVKELETPTPKENEIRVRVHATAINFGDLIARKFNEITPRKFSMPFLFWVPTKLTFGLKRPKKNILGSEFSGTVEKTGKNVKSFKEGDEVFGYRGINMGANVEYLVVHEKSLVSLKPVNMSLDEACSIPYGGLTALNLLRKVNVQKGQKVLINGASGGIGAFAVQLAKHYGAEVTGVCSTPRVDFVRSLGADKVIDYSKENFTTNGEKYDLIVDITRKTSYSKCKNSLTSNGRYLLASFKMRQLGQMIWTSMFSNKKVVCALSSENIEDLKFIKELVEKGKIKMFVDKRFPMNQAAEAHRYIEEGNKKGNVIITM